MLKLENLLDNKIVNTKDIEITISEIFIFLIIIAATWIILWVIKSLYYRHVRRKHIDKGKGHAIYQIIKYFLWILAITIGLETIGIKVTLLVAGSAALLVGLGLGLQQIFKDIVSGIFLLFEGTIKVGDVVELDGMIGRVKEINVRSSKIETRDNVIMIIPNSKFIEGYVINWSVMEKLTRFQVDVGVAYGSDIQLVKKTLLECAKTSDEISQNPKPFVRFNNFGDSSLEFQLYFWTQNTFLVENIKSDLRFEIDSAFRKNKITIAFPQRDIHIKQMPEK
jgi:small-conductance mechanosensitive channel